MTSFPSIEGSYQCYLKFRAPHQERFQALSVVFEVLKQEKQKICEEEANIPEPESDEEIDRFVEEGNRKRKKFAEKLFVLCDDRALSHFWWPTVQERNEYWKQWETTPKSQRYSDLSLKRPWDFSSMVDAVLQAEYELLSCRMLTEDLGRLVYFSFGWPYGGSDALKALIEAYDCEIIEERV